jgi:hypothetical protein
MKPKVPNKSDIRSHAPAAKARNAHTTGVGARWARPELAEAEDLVVAILNSLLGNRALDPYWFFLSQGDLSAEDLLRDRRVDHAVVHDVARLVSQLTPH